ncbi:hypothetical protein QBC40DRAFT_233983 [Triangularia verruculosa]|uniref:Protein FAF1 n=1 Tax=Triangularia verruculosa TaxID=2587418 RepID=A0AAN6XC18_9PEZI|nr:hypothetical protein QBC40DRAFT_233983 [Triangularia verruculosa]
MPSALGKRKAPPAEEDVVDAQEALRRHFEARFKMPTGIAPCAAPPSKKQARDEDEDDEDDEDSDFDSDASEAESWDGVSSEEEEEDDSEDEPHVVQVVDHTKSSSTTITSTMSKKELKAYLSSRPPSHTSAAQSDTPNPKKKKADDSSQAEDSAAFLANDLALQRLIAESHILSAAGGNSSHWESSAAAGTATNTRAFAAGRTAKKTTDLRFQALGAKESILAQAKMPMSMRKGIVSHNTAKEAKRRREAKENGIILEREVKKSKSSRGKRSGGGGRGEREVGAPGVGRMRGATLRISAREAEVLNRPGPARRGGRGGRGGRR